MISEKMRQAACKAISDRGKGNNVTIPDIIAMLEAALSAQVQDMPDLDTRMKAAGMYTIAEMMGVTPLTKWKSNPAINSVEAFSEWLDRKVAEYLSMKAGYDLGDKSEDDDLFEVLAHSGVFSTIRDQFQVVTASLGAEAQDVAASSAAIPSYLPASYVESDHFNIINEKVDGVLGTRILIREYRLKQNPDQSPEHIFNSVIATWAMAGRPTDAVFHLGASFHRVTRISKNTMSDESRTCRTEVGN